MRGESRTSGYSETALAVECALCEGELVAELCRFLLSVLQCALPAAFVILCGPHGMVWHTVLQPVIHGAGHCMGRGDQCLGGTQLPCEAPIERAPCAVGAENRLGGHAEGLGGTVAGF